MHCQLVLTLSNFYFSLPIPWLLYWAAFQEPISVDSAGMVCSIFLLFIMLMAVIATIAVNKWRMNKLLGIIMLFLYVVFEVLSVLLALKIIICPVEVWTFFIVFFFSKRILSLFKIYVYSHFLLLDLWTYKYFKGQNWKITITGCKEKCNMIYVFLYEMEWNRCPGFVAQYVRYLCIIYFIFSLLSGLDDNLVLWTWQESCEYFLEVLHILILLQ